MSDIRRWTTIGLSFFVLGCEEEAGALEVPEIRVHREGAASGTENAERPTASEAPAERSGRAEELEALAGHPLPFATVEIMLPDLRDDMAAAERIARDLGGEVLRRQDSGHYLLWVDIEGPQALGDLRDRVSAHPDVFLGLAYWTTGDEPENNGQRWPRQASESGDRR